MEHSTETVQAIIASLQRINADLEAVIAICPNQEIETIVVKNRSMIEELKNAR